MLKVLVPAGTKSLRVSRSGVFGKACPAPPTRPPPGTPNFPASAGRAAIARNPEPPFWFRSSPFPHAITDGEDSLYQRASVLILSGSTPQISAALSGGYARALSM